MASVLVIDDDPVTRTVVRAILESAGHTVSEADNGHTGLVMFYANSPDLVITDIFMPQKDGIETIRTTGDPTRDQDTCLVRGYRI